MDLDDALASFGLDRAADWPAVRAAYRAAMRVVHPDVSSGDAATARRVNEAFALLRAGYLLGDASAARVSATRVDDDGLVLVAPVDEVFSRLLDALHDIGEVTDADPENCYLEALIADGAGRLSIRLHGRADATEALFTLDAASDDAPPPIDVVVRSIADHLRSRT